MDLLKTILLYLSMLYVASVQVAPDPATVNITPSPVPTPIGIFETISASTPSPTPVPTPSITANPSYGQLVMGDRNKTVGNVQRRLQELGYYTGKIDSAYGNQTRNSVEQFQYQNGLTVDGIAGRYTQTILFESEDVVAAPTATPAFQPDKTQTPPPPTEEPAETSPATADTLVTLPPAATDTPVVTPPQATDAPIATQTPEPTETPTANVSVLLDKYTFVMSGFTEPLTAQGTDTLLHPVESDETIFVPLLEILRDTGSVMVESTEGDLTELAFSVSTDFYQISYKAGTNGSLTDIIFEKNAQPQPLAVRSAVLLDGVFYLPLEDMEKRTGITFAMDEASGIITVTMPAVGQ